jgi:hypothetical protein
VVLVGERVVVHVGDDHTLRSPGAGVVGAVQAPYLFSFYFTIGGQGVRKRAARVSLTSRVQRHGTQQCRS